MEQKGKVVIVTGAASGMGYATVKKFLAEGAIVVGFSLEKETDIEHHNYTYHSGNITCEEDCKKVVDLVVQNHNKIDCLINCAGITREGTLETTTLDTFKQTFDINVFGTFNMCKAAIGYMKNHKSTIVNISSNMGAKPLQERIAYNPSKAAVNMLTECIALDYAPNVRANTVMPGIVETPMIQSRFDAAENPEELRELYKTFYPLNRIGHVDDVVNAIMFLCSDKSDWITGAHIPVCGGDQL